MIELTNLQDSDCHSPLINEEPRQNIQNKHLQGVFFHFEGTTICINQEPSKQASTASSESAVEVHDLQFYCFFSLTYLTYCGDIKCS